MSCNATPEQRETYSNPAAWAQIPSVLRSQFWEKSDELIYCISALSPCKILTSVTSISVLVRLLDFLFHFSEFLLEGTFSV